MNALQISFDHLSNINYAAYQNHVSVLRKLPINNEDPENLENLKVIITPDDFFAYGNQSNIARQILQIVDTEAPVTHNLLMKRLLNAWGIGRAGSRMSAHFDRILQQLYIYSTQYDRQPIYWIDEKQALSYQTFRHKYPLNQKRDAEDLPVEEVANAIKYILTRQISLPKADLVRECAKLFGYARVGGNVENAMLMGIRYAVDKGGARMDGERVVGE